MPPRSRESFFVAPSTAAETMEVIMSLPNEGFNRNTIPVYMFKGISDYISPLLSNIFNSSVTDGRFPDILKIARVTPIHKSKNHKIVLNFRPISALSFFSKIIEKLMKARAVKYLDRNNIMYSKQFGFRINHSTSDAVFEFVDLCSSSLDQKLYTIAVFLDLSKAFDTVNKSIMLKKLEWLGLRGLVNEWFESYLSDRKMFVEINSHSSAVKCLNIGLPQGAVTSPWLFSLYINDMHRASEKLKFVHFADDTTVYMSRSDLNQLCVDVSAELERVEEWMRVNRLSLNDEKTSFMLFTHSPVNRADLVIEISGRRVQNVRLAKCLGMIVDDLLHFLKHVNDLSKRLCLIRPV